MNGRMFDVIIKDVTKNGFSIWADNGFFDLLTAIEGVSHVGQTNATKYLVHVDPRYDLGIIMEKCKDVFLKDTDSEIIWKIEND